MIWTRQPRRAHLILLVALAAITVVVWGVRYKQFLPPADIPAFLIRENIRGAVMATVRPGFPDAVRVFGEASDRSRELAASTRFPLASLSKPVTAAAIRKLIEQGDVDLDDRVFALLTPQPVASDARYAKITVRHLLQHTSGLSQSPSDPMFESGHPTGCQQAMDVSLARRLESNPGSKMRYSNTGYCLLGALIEDLTGKPYPRAVRALLDLPEGTSSFTLGPPAQPTPREGWALADKAWEKVGAAGGWFVDAPSAARHQPG